MGYDEFAHNIVARRPPPWHTSGGWENRVWSETDTILATEWLQHQAIAVGVDVVWQAVLAAATEHCFHPVRDYLTGIQWDGKSRLDALAHDILGAEDTHYARAVTRTTFIAAVAPTLNEAGLQSRHGSNSGGAAGQPQVNWDRCTFPALGLVVGRSAAT